MPLITGIGGEASECESARRVSDDAAKVSGGAQGTVSERGSGGGGRVSDGEAKESDDEAGCANGGGVVSDGEGVSASDDERGCGTASDGAVGCATGGGAGFGGAAGSADETQGGE